MQKIQPIHILCLILIASFILTLKTLYHFPIYPDEIAVRFWLSRTVFDMPMRMNLYPACQSFLQPLNAIWLLPGLIEWLIHGNIDSLSTLRLVGLFFYFFMMLLLIVHLIKKIDRQKQNRLLTIFLCTGFVIAFFSIGVQPFFLVTNRQEQLILPGLIILLLLSNSIANHPNDTKVTTFFQIIIYFLFISIMLYAHPKALFLAPVFLLIGYQLSTRFKTKFALIVISGMLLLELAGNYHSWINALTCSQAPMLDQYLKSFNVDISNLVTKPTLFLGEITNSLKNFPQFINEMTFQPKFDIDYLPGIKTSAKMTLFNALITSSIIFLLLFLIIGLCVSYLKDIRNKKYVSTHLILLVALFSGFITGLFDLMKVWYGAGYFLTFINILTLFYIAEHINSFLKYKVFHLFFAIIALCATMSLITLHHKIGKPFAEGYQGPSISVKNFAYKAYIQKMNRVANACAIYPKIDSHIVLDDYTYSYYKQAKYPALITYIPYHTDPDTFLKLMNKHLIKSIAVRCSTIQLIPYLKKKNIVQIEDLCCYSESSIKELITDKGA